MSSGGHAPATTHPAPAKAAPFNPNWIQAATASLLLAILLRVGLHIPILTTFIALGIIFAAQVVFANNPTGTTKVLAGIKIAGRTLMGLVVFLTLRFIAAKVIGLYPIETYQKIDASGGFYWILPGTDISSVILWEVLFAFIAGGIVVAWVKGKGTGTVGMIFGVSFMVLTLQYALPAYTATWPNKAKVSQELVDNGVVGASFHGARVFLFGRPAETQDAPAYTPAPVIRSTEGRLLREDCVMPCTVNITYRAEILRGDGRMKIRWQSVGWVEYPATGDVKAPENATSGETEFVSLEEGRPAIRVKVFEKVPVLGGR